MWLAYQEIDISPTIEQLSKSELPNLMAMSFVFISIAMVLVALGWTAKIIKAPKQKTDGRAQSAVDPNANLIKVLGQFADRLESMDNIVDVIVKLSDTIDTGSKMQGEQHQDFAKITNELKNDIQHGLENVVKATATMSDQLTPLIKQLISESGKGLSDKDKADITQSVSSEIATLWAKNKGDVVEVIRTAVSDAISEKLAEHMIIPKPESPIEVKEKDTTNAKPTSTIE